MEVKSPSATFWKNKRVFLTGHTGFKGGWLSLWLAQLGSEVHGFALEPPTELNLFDCAKVGSAVRSTIGDVRDADAVYRAMVEARPDIVLHMAAQPLVLRSYRAPIETYATNVMGTVHLLDAVRRVGTVRAVVNVTTDKCYENREWVWPYREHEPMGGHDPYSSSKGCSELVTSAYRRSFFADNVAVASARAGNVVGGGDWAEDRLIPDILRAFERDAPVEVRNPQAVRPWQHVLEPLSGYLLLAEHLWKGEQAFAEAWNFGPHDADARPVSWIVDRMVERWGARAGWTTGDGPVAHEAGYLKLDISKARAGLGWQPRWPLAITLDHIVNWHRAWLDKSDMQPVCLSQIALYANTADGVQQ